MTDEKTNSDTCLNNIEELRARNNRFWMGIVRIAMDHAPDETRMLLKSIGANDKDITEWLSRL